MPENAEDAKEEASLLFCHAFVFPFFVDCSSGHFGGSLVGGETPF